ncbi:hypothetical protein NE619_05205 [Anaerovorax odorimutans]|uniref:Tetratricopeptide repeat protein n=1 Tax=Anaerovorax odorimutans TaxID=109327 RepID=A0ABT1RLR9_9FIRM|nr:hypothetical protein [Anaerovorax odorimutans]MCQ4636117.1 hypothetical protein [Anaerovorax odorimutans]
MKYTCFVISPIGEEGSDIRQHADDLFEMVIGTALQKYDLDIIRADRLSTIASITSEIIKLIQEADLCIVDITGQNANVMYECGRRHETGKPTILMAKNGEKLPFDINIMRTIFFELDTPRNVHKAMSTLQEFVDRIYKEGFSSNASGESLSTVIEVLNRIERKVNLITSKSSEVTLDTLRENDFGELDPREVLVIALKQRNLPLAESLMSKLEVMMDLDIYYKTVLPSIAALGSIKAVEILEKNIIPVVSTYAEEEQEKIIGSVITAYIKHDLESKGLEVLNDYFENMLNNRSVLGEFRAFLLNQKQRLLFGLGEEKYSEIMEILDEVTKISSNPSYFYNYALVAFDMKKYDLAEQNIVACLRLYQNEQYDDDHVQLALRIFKQNGRESEYNKWREWLKTNAPLKLQLFDLME